MYMEMVYYRTAALEHIARDMLKLYNPNYLNWKPQAVPIEKIIEDIYKISIEYMRLTEAGDELGRMIYDNGFSTRFNEGKDDYELVAVTEGTMLIESLLVNDPNANGRYRFTLAHELSHWRLHKHIYKGTGIAAATYGTDMQTHNAIEWQANYLAKAILMPVSQVKRGFHGIADTNQNKIITLAGVFEVSKQAMEYRLRELGLV